MRREKEIVINKGIYLSENIIEFAIKHTNEDLNK